MGSFTEELKKKAHESGADLIGIASIDRFKGVLKENHPASIFPEAKSVVVIGKRIARGAVRGVEEGTQFETFGQYGYQWLENRFLAMATFKTAEFLEDNKWEAVPLLNLPIQIPAMGIPVREGLPAPNVLVDFDAAAVRAGLGEIGYLGLFLSPEFGPLQRFQMILTDAPLEADPILEKDICDRSKKLRDFCPLGAVSEKETVIELCGKKMLTAAIDNKKCADCRNGALPNRYHPAGIADRLGALCSRNCLDHLEKNNRLTKKFVNPFRKRKPWQVTSSKVIIEEGNDIE